jgi:hypothetical protein
MLWLWQQPQLPGPCRRAHAPRPRARRHIGRVCSRHGQLHGERCDAGLHRSRLQHIPKHGHPRIHCDRAILRAAYERIAHRSRRARLQAAC